MKEETTPTPEPVKKDDSNQKTEPVKKEETPTPEPVNPEPVKEEEPQPQELQDTVASGNIINFNNNINKFQEQNIKRYLLSLNHLH